MIHNCFHAWFNAWFSCMVLKNQKIHQCMNEDFSVTFFHLQIHKHLYTKVSIVDNNVKCQALNNLKKDLCYDNN